MTYEELQEKVSKLLDDEGYKGMTDNIADNFKNIQKFKDETQH